MSTNFQVQGAHPYCVDAVAICKLTSLEDSLEEALCSINGGMDAVHLQSTLRTVVWDSPNSYELLHSSSFTATVMAFLLAGVHTFFGQPEFTSVIV